MQYFDIPSQHPFNWEKLFRRALLALLIFLLITVVVAGVTATPSASQNDNAPPTQAPTTDQAHMFEQRVTLTNGTTVTCIFFPSPFYGGSCDWARARGGSNP